MMMRDMIISELLPCRAASLSEHARDEHQCLHQSVVLHRPLPHPLHGQHTKEVRLGLPNPPVPLKSAL